MEPQVKFRGGGSFVGKKPQFSADGQTVFLAWRNSIVSYSTQTAKRLREYRGLEDPIVNFQVHNLHNYEHLTACSTSGEIVSWKVEIGLRNLKASISGIQKVESFHLITPPEDDGEENVKFLLSWANEEENKTGFVRYNLLRGKKQFLNLKLDRSKYNIAVNRSRSPFFAVTQGRKLTFVKLKDNAQSFKHSITSAKHFTCVACHPQEECVITGDDQGRVLVWYNLTHREPSQAVYHWHTLPMRSLSFSSSGSNFFSGAGECVLVKWHLDDPHHRQFLPRLPSALEHITVANENQFIAVATGDNAIRVLDPRLETVSIVQHLVLGTHFPAGIVFDQRTKSMILNGFTGHVQFYSPNDMTLLYNLDVVGQNKLTQERNCHIENTNVTKIAVDSTGLWLAAVEERVDVSFSFELRLKFFLFDTVKQLFQLNTSIELPHEKSITQLQFQPPYDDELRCVTVANDKKFKIWQVVNADTVYQKGNAWMCSKVGYYRDLPCSALSFSSDGSLMAVGFGPTVTAWLPETCELKCSLVHPTSRERLTAIQFGTLDQCHLLVATTSEQLSVWNLLGLSMVWTVPLHVSLLVANPFVSHMAVFTTDRKLFVFYPGSSSPLFTHTLHKEIENVVAATYIPCTSNSDTNSHWYRNSQLFFITSKQELYCLDAIEDQSDSVDILSESFGSSLFKSLMPKSKSDAVQKANPVEHLTSISCKNKQLKQLLDAPVHTMVPIRLTCGFILKSIILEHKLPPQQDSGT